MYDLKEKIILSVIVLPFLALAISGIFVFYRQFWFVPYSIIEIATKSFEISLFSVLLETIIIGMIMVVAKIWGE